MQKVFFSAIIYVSLLLTACDFESPDPFIRQQLAKRYTKDSLFKLSTLSPIHPNDRKNFLNLSYFQPKKEYIVKAKFTELSPPQSLTIIDSDGDEQEYLRVGKLNFTLLGKPCQLSAYQNARFVHDPDKNHTLFLPFWDETNGKETYASGRFMDVKYKSGMQEVELDFNDAYNPYCAYSHDFKCPLPPAENRIPFRVEAGETNYHLEESEE